MKKILIQWLIIFSIIFTITTLFSSTLMLILGETHDTHAHILLRGGFVFAAATTMIIFFNYKPKNKFLEYFIPYAVAQTVVFFILFIISLFDDLHPDAYRDAFFNFTGVAIIVIIVLIVMDVLKAKRAQ